MALTSFQRDVCQLIADHRKASGESYVADGTAINEATGSFRISRDIDIFHDTATAVAASFQKDRTALEGSGIEVRVTREREGYAEAVAQYGIESVILEWTADSAFRFFPLVEHPVFGLTLHPFDLATNKVLALVGRLEPRDWVDMIAGSVMIQPLGFVAWAASGKDPGFSPEAILEQAGRSGRYAQEELAILSFEGSPPDAQELSKLWHEMLPQAKELVASLPAAEVGRCVLNEHYDLYQGSHDQLLRDLGAGKVYFHQGYIGGSMPKLKGPRL